MSHVEFYCINLFFFSFQEITSRTRCCCPVSGLLSFYTHSEWIVLSFQRRLSVKRERKIYGRKLFLFHNFLVACRHGRLCCQKNCYFYIIYKICKNIDIVLYMYMFLWNLLFLAIQVIPICLFSFHPWIIGLTQN